MIMARMKKYMKFLSHICYLLFLSYLITQRSPVTVPVKNITRFLADLKHILLWSKIHQLDDDGQRHFINKKCENHNCYFTTNRSLFRSLGYFDAIIFNLQDLNKDYQGLPKQRSWNQRYIFAANDSADNYPVCNPIYDNFFNWTWTYRSDSTIVYQPIAIHNIHDEPLGWNFRWMPWSSMRPPDNFLANQLVSKHKAAAIFLDKCSSRSAREIFLGKLINHLAKYNLTVDVYGQCGPMKCKRRTMAPCYWRLRKMYFFYLALEDSISPDYITDIVLHAYKNHVVPIVIGGANYKKLLPPNSYISAMTIPIETLAKDIYDIMHNRQRYLNFFRWKNHYIVKESTVLDACSLCSTLNIPAVLTHRIISNNFRMWWNPDYERRCATNNFLML